MKPGQSWLPVRAARAIPALLVRPLLFLAVVLFGTVTVLYTVLFAPRQPPEKIYSGPITQQHQDGLALTNEARAQQLCKIRQLCSDYAKARQACAAARNYNLCIDFKLGARAASAGRACRRDGDVLLQYDDMPKSSECPVSSPDSMPQ